MLRISIQLTLCRLLLLLLLFLFYLACAKTDLAYVVEDAAEREEEQEIIY